MVVGVFVAVLDLVKFAHVCAKKNQQEIEIDVDLVSRFVCERHIGHNHQFSVVFDGRKK